MSSRLSKSPDGLLGTLDLKNLGHNPLEVSDTLQASVEAIDWYLLRNRVTVSGTGPFVAVGTGINMTSSSPTTAYYFTTGNFVVPTTETIRIKQLAVINVRVAADAALTLQSDVYIRRASGNVTVGIGAAVFGPHPATDLVFIQPIPLTAPLWLAPGDFLRCIPSTTQTAAGSSIGLQIDFDSVPSG